MARNDGRDAEAIRPVEIERGFTEAAPGSVLYRSGRTIVFVTASVEERVPPWMAGRGQGWLTAEYSMLPASTHQRKARPTSTGRGLDGRTHEIQRLVGRALRSVTQLNLLGERTVWIDCDVLQADGGTRTAAVNAAYIALCDALAAWPGKRPLERWPIIEAVGAISVGLVGQDAVVDLDYLEDHKAIVDMNLIMTESGKWLEIQGTGEQRPFTEDELNRLLAVGRKGLEQVFAASRQALAQRS